MPGQSFVVAVVRRSRRILVGSVSLCFLFACSAQDDSSPAVRELRRLLEGKNLVVVLLDAAAAGHFGYAGYERATTPHIDALARESIVFETAYSPCASTGHTLYAMFTSSYPFYGERQLMRGVEDVAFVVTDSTRLMSELLGGHFAHRSAFAANEWFAPRLGFDRGFTHFYEAYEDSAVPDPTQLRAQRIVDLFRQDLELWDETPSFSYIHFLEPHTPYTPPDEYARLFDPVAADSIEATANALTTYRQNPPDARTQKMVRALYDGNLAYADSKVGELIDELKQRGLWDDTVFVLIADHGEAFWQHGVFGHGRHTYEEFVRIPFVLRIPGAEFAAKRISPTVSLIDLLPTFTDMFGLGVPAGVRGMSLLPLIAGETEAFENRPVFMRNTHGDIPEVAVRRGPLKFIYRDVANVAEGYDLRTDPQEKKNLLEERAPAPEFSELRRLLSEWVSAALYETAPADTVDAELKERLRALGYFN